MNGEPPESKKEAQFSISNLVYKKGTKFFCVNKLATRKMKLVNIGKAFYSLQRSITCLELT